MWGSLVAPNGELTPRQRKFVDAYLINGNGAQAAIQAGYSRGSAKVTASRLLTDANVQAALQQAQQEAARSAGVTHARIIQELAKLAFTDITQVVSWKGRRLTLKDSADLTPAQAAAIVEITEHETPFTKTLKVKLYSKASALESLLKCLQAIDLEERVKALEEALTVQQINGRPNRWP